MPATTPFIGIDFGTSNTSIGMADAAGRVQLVPLPDGAGTGTVSHWRSVLFFEEGRKAVAAGAPAIGRYLETGGEGRLIQSVKSHLASASFTRTSIFGKLYGLEELIASYLRAVRAASPIDLGHRCVCGRPVRYWGQSEPADEARALGRMRRALELAGFDEVVFEYEPIGAAASYAARLDRDELILVADFGGGTTDFSVVRVGPGIAPNDPAAVLGNGGIGVSGDAFDARVIDAVVAPQLGHGTRYKVDMGADAAVPAWLYSHLRRWHHLSFLKAADTAKLLHRISSGSLAPAKIERLVRLIDEDLGLALHQAVERAKVGLSRNPEAALALRELDLDTPIARTGFDQWIEEDLQAIASTLDDVLAQAGVPAAAIDRVFATGGTSLVPAVHDQLVARFGAGKLVGGEELTSVAWGLAARARTHFG